MKAALLEKAKRLSVKERIELAEALWDSIAEDADAGVLPIPESHRAELDRRLADFEAHPDVGSPWPEVRARLERAK
jgi:putative addiction module component (TIGR02574 family)